MLVLALVLVWGLVCASLNKRASVNANVSVVYFKQIIWGKG